jgi:hypothetical protein
VALEKNMAFARNQFVLNLCPLLFDDAEITVGVFSFRNREAERDETLRSLRSEHRGTFAFRRHDKDEILAVPLRSDVEHLGDSTRDIRLTKHLNLCAVLMREAFINFRARWHQKSRGYHPIQFVGTGSKDDLMARPLDSLPWMKEYSRPDWLSVQTQYEIEIRVFELENRTPFLGMALEVGSRWSILENCAELAQRGLPLPELYVKRWIAEDDPRMEHHSELLGRVIAEDGDDLLLDDARTGWERVPASEVFLDPNRRAFKHCLTHAFGRRAAQVQNALENELARLHSGPGQLEKIRSVVQRLQGRDFELVPGTSVSIGGLINQQDEAFPPIETTPRTVYIYNMLGDRTDVWHNRGLKQFGPYSGETFTPSRPRVCVICQQGRRGHVDIFLNRLLNGYIPSGRPEDAEKSVFAQGLLKLYELEKVAFEVFEAGDDSASAYHRAARQALTTCGDGPKWDLVLVQTDESFHGRFGDDNPYLVTKATFLMQGIPTQEFEMETAMLPANQLGYVLNNMALAGYAKMNGVPWLIRANRSITHELVIGLGSASIGQGRLGRKERVVGITTVFSNDGNYWVSNISRAAAMEDFEATLLESLESTINHVKRAMNWQERQQVRLIFHAFKPFKNEQANAVKELVSTLGNYAMSYAFLHVIQDHRYILFDESQRGVKDYQQRILKGELAPLRGQFLRLSGSEALLTLTGAQEVLRASDGIPRPILLRLHPESSFRDLSYLTKQVFAFACHSWRGFQPAPLPVTVFYSQLMARLLGQLETTRRWNSDVMLGQIGATRWFL